jgi:hypothetical protein
MARPITCRLGNPKRILRGKLRHAAQRALIGKAHSVSIGGLNCVPTLVTTVPRQTSWLTVSMPAEWFVEGD